MKLFATITALTLMGSGLVPALRADEWDKNTIITIDRPIDIQGTVLSPGSYVMKLLAGSVDRNTVQIFNVEQNRVVATIVAIPAWKIQPSDNTEFTFYEPAGGGHRHCTPGSILATTSALSSSDPVNETVSPRLRRSSTRTL